MHGERDNKHKAEDAVPEGAVPAYLLDREATTRAKVRQHQGDCWCEGWGIAARLGHWKEEGCY